MNEKEITKILKAHAKWLENDAGGVCANLSDANLSGANLSDANLSGADLYCADLSDADLSGADLCCADLSDANLSGADLIGADLSDANLSGANLSGANLSGANLIGADLSDANLAHTQGVPPLSCPEEGTYIGFKKAGGYIIVLEIAEDAKRSSATSRKCRASKAKVLRIENIDGTTAIINGVASDFDESFIYTVGETISVNDFDEDRWRECAPGIHHFITRQEAVSYT